MSMTAADTPCPDEARLARLLLGALPAAEAEPLRQHLLLCGRCAEAAGRLPASDPFLDEARRAAVAGIADPPAVVALVQRLKQLPVGPTAETPLPDAEPSTGTHVPVLAAGAAFGPYRIEAKLGQGGMGAV